MKLNSRWYNVLSHNFINANRTGIRISPEYLCYLPQEIRNYWGSNFLMQKQWKILKTKCVLYLNERVVYMFDLAKTFLTTTPEYKLFLIIKRHFHWGRKQINYWNKRGVFHFRSTNWNTHLWHLVVLVLQDFEGLGEEERTKA